MLCLVNLQLFMTNLQFTNARGYPLSTEMWTNLQLFMANLQLFIFFWLLNLIFCVRCDTHIQKIEIYIEQIFSFCNHFKNIKHDMNRNITQTHNIDRNSDRNTISSFTWQQFRDNSHFHAFKKRHQTCMCTQNVPIPNTPKTSVSSDSEIVLLYR